MPTELHFVRGDLCAETLIRAGLPGSQLVILQDSLSWGPCVESDDDSPRNAFWQSALRLPAIVDAHRLGEVVKSAPGVNIVIWPEGFLDSTLAMAWAVATVDRLLNGQAHMLVPRAIGDKSQFLDSEIGKNMMAADLRSIRVDEIDLCKLVWNAHVEGDLHSLPGLLQSETAALPRWLSAIESAKDRYPFLHNGLPPFVNDLLKPLHHATEGISVARLVGGFMHRRSNTQLFIDADAILFHLLRELSDCFRVVNLNCLEAANYPAHCQICLTTLGNDVLSGKTAVDLRPSNLLRWWGGRDLLVGEAGNAGSG